MFKLFTCLSAIVMMFLVMSCNNSSDNNTANTDSTVSESDSATSTSNQPANSNTINESTAFNKVLSDKNISFAVTAKGKGSLQELTIQPSGLTEDNRVIILEIDPLVDAQIADLNADSHPELLIFTQAAGSGSYGKVIAYSVNNGKSISSVSFPPTADNSKINKGYMGHDKFTVENNQLVQTFPIYGEGDANSQPTGKNRVVSYRLKNGEASRIFEVDRVKEVARQ